MSCWLAAVMIWVTWSAEEAIDWAVRSPAAVTAPVERSLVDSSRSSRLDAAFAQGVDHGIAGMAERQRDVFALLGERAGDALRHLLHLVGDQIADRGDVVREVEMDAGNGGADVLGLRHERLALVGEVAEQAADAHFVVVVGALDGGHFVVHQRFKFGGAGERAFDAVAHGGDFAADGLADRHHRLARRRLRLRQPQRHRGHGFGDRAHLLRAADELGEHVEGDDRQQDRDGGGDGDQRAHARGGEQRLQFGTEHEGGAGRCRPPRRRRRWWRARRACARPGAGETPAASGRHWRGRRWPGAAASRRPARPAAALPSTVRARALAGASAPLPSAGDLTAGALSPSPSPSLSAASMALRVSAIGSSVFWGLLAISVVASFVRRTAARGPLRT